MKKILVLGAGIYQVPLIKKVKEMGYFVIVSSIKGNYPGFQYADKVYYKNTMDKQAILDIAIKENIQAILTTGTDVAVSTIGYVCDCLGLPGISQASAEMATNKALMKYAMLDGNVRTGNYRKVSTLKQAELACLELLFPVIFKCVDKSGSRGISKVSCEKEIENAFVYAMKNTNLDYIIVEQFIDGLEIGVDGYIGENELWVIPHNKLVFNNGVTNVPIGHVFPYNCTEELKQDIRGEIAKAAKALGLTNVFFNADVMIKDNECYIIEIGARCGATCIPELISLHLGIDYYEKMIENALGEKIALPDKPIAASAGELLLSEYSGQISDIQLNCSSDIYDVSLDYKIGDKVNSFKVGPDRIGQVIVSGEDIEKALKKLEIAKKDIKVVVNSTNILGKQLEDKD